MIEQFVLGVIQGVAEWLPVSSKSLIYLVEINWFNRPAEYQNLVQTALVLHIGTFLAGLVYLRSDVKNILKTLLSWQGSNDEGKRMVKFIFIATLISGVLGIFSFSILDNISKSFNPTGKFVTGLVGLLLIITGLVQIRSRRIQSPRWRDATDVKIKDAWWVGLAQGIATIPGFSRSGMTVAALLLRKFDDVHALRLSFLLSLPIVLAGNIFLEIKNFSIKPVDLVGVATAFVFGYLTIGRLLALAQKINFGYFVILFGILTFIAALF